MEIKKKTEKKNIDFSNTQDFHLQQRVKAFSVCFIWVTQFVLIVLGQSILWMYYHKLFFWMNWNPRCDVMVFWHNPQVNISICQILYD